MNLCPECGAILQNGKMCRDYFDQMISWDFADFSGAGRVHHLTVLCYYIQHPSYYSPRGLEEAIKILKNVVEKNLTDTELYQAESNTFSSSQRDWHVNGTEKEHGSFRPSIHWSHTAKDVVMEGIATYPSHVKEWSQSIYSDISSQALSGHE